MTLPGQSIESGDNIPFCTAAPPKPDDPSGPCPKPPPRRVGVGPICKRGSAANAPTAGRVHRIGNPTGCEAVYSYLKSGSYTPFCTAAPPKPDDPSGPCPKPPPRRVGVGPICKRGSAANAPTAGRVHRIGNPTGCEAVYSYQNKERRGFCGPHPSLTIVPDSETPARITRPERSGRCRGTSGW